MILFRKEVDKSLLYQGISIPMNYQDTLSNELEIQLEIGDSIPVTVIVENIKYLLSLKNESYDRKKYPNRAPIIQIRYSYNSDIAKHLRKIFTSTNYLIEECVNKRKSRERVFIPNNIKEYIDIQIIQKQKLFVFNCYPINEHEETKFIDNLSNYDLQKIAIEHSKSVTQKKYVAQKQEYVRDAYISEYAKRRANGICQLCENKAPFKRKDGQPYLESHHILWLSQGGIDELNNVVALCPNCHRKMHILNNQEDREKLKNINKSF